MLKSQIILDLKFDDPFELQNSEYQLQVVVIGDQFKTSTGQHTPVGYSIIHTLPPQLPASTAAVLSASTQTLSSSMNTLVVSNLALSFMLRASLSLLLGLINCLQIVVYMPLIQVKVPSNVGVLLSKLIDVATFNILPMGMINARVFNFTETPPYSDNAYQASFKTRNILENLGSLYVYFLLLPLQFLVRKVILVISYLKVCKCCKRLVTDPS